jgi:recombination protein RecA
MRKERLVGAKASEIAPRRGAAGWGLDALAGRLTELSGLGAAAQLSLAFTLVREAQRRGEPTAWITDRASTFFPPDAAASGIDLDALPVVFAPGAAAAARAADKLARSGAFGLIVLDLIGTDRKTPAPLLSRLTGLAQQHDAALLFLTEKPAEQASLSSLISLRCESSRKDAGAGRFFCLVRSLKDKRHGPGWTSTEVHRGPVGLR